MFAFYLSATFPPVQYNLRRRLVTQLAADGEIWIRTGPTTLLDGPRAQNVFALSWATY